MIRQLSSTCFEWSGGGFDIAFLDDGRPKFTPVVPPLFCPPPSASADAPARRFTRAEIDQCRAVLDPVLARFGRFDLCGSYRRGKPTSKDMDFVVECSREAFWRLRAELTAVGVIFHRGACEIMNGTFGEIPVDVFRADPESYTSILIWRTGSMEHNVYCAVVARRKGMRVRRVGIETRSGTLLHPRSEEEFFATLGVPYLAPHERDLEG